MNCSRLFLVACFLVSFLHVKGQSTYGYLVEVQVTGGYIGVNCNGAGSGVSATLKDGNGNVLNSGTISGANSFQVTSFTYLVSDGSVQAFKVSASGHASCSSQPNGNATLSDEQFTVDANHIPATCATEYIFNNAPTNYSLTVYIAVTNLKVNTPKSVNADCEDKISLTVDDPAPSFDWQVSEDGSNFVTFATNVGSSIDATISQLSPSGFTTSKFGNRWVRVIAYSCSKRRKSDAVEVRFKALPPDAEVTAISPTCFGGSNGGFKIDISSSTSEVDDFNVQVFEGNSSLPIFEKGLQNTSTITFNTLSLGEESTKTYRIEIRNDSGPETGTCASKYSEDLFNPPQFTIDYLSSTPVACHINDTSDPSKKSDGSVSLSLSNGSSTFSYQYAVNGSDYSSITPNDPGTTMPVFQGLSKGIYKFKATDSKSCNSNELENVSVSGPSSPVNVTELNKINVICKDIAEGGIDIKAAGGNGGYTYAWSGPNSYTSSNEDISNVYSGTYNLKVTDAKGCANNSYSSVITQPATKLNIIPSTSLYGSYNTSCLIYDGTIDLGYQNKSYPIATYEWKKNGSLLSPSPTDNEHLSELGPGSYNIKVKDSKGCEATSTIEMSANPGITISTLATSNFNGYNTKCNSPTSFEGEGKATVVNSFGTLEYVWDHDEYLNNAIASDLAPGVYHVTVTDGNHCVADDNLTIIPPPSIMPHLQVTSNYNGPQISCPGYSDGSIEAFPVNGFGSYHYSWQHNRNLTSAFSSGLSSGTYTVTVKDDYGCSAQESIALIDPPGMKFLFEKKSYNGADLSCYGKQDGGIRLTVLNGLGSATSFRYMWSNNASTKDVSLLGQGDYTISVTDGNHCVKDSSISIINPPEISLAIQRNNDFNGFDVRCYGEISGDVTALASGGTGDFSYLWSNGTTTMTNESLSVGYYSVSVTDINGCKQARSVTITQPSPFTGSVNLDHPVSCFGFSDGKVILNGEGGVAPYSYSQDQSSWLATNEFADLPVGENEFYVRDGNGCSVSLNQTISQPPPLQLSFVDKMDAACNDPVGSVKAIVTGGNEGYSYSWVNDVTQNKMNDGSLLLNAIAGIYRVEVKDSKNCTISDRTSISSIGGATFDVVNITPATCFDSADGSALISIISGTAPYTHTWSDGQILSQANNLGKGKYFATVKDGLGCETIQEVVITSPEQLTSQYIKKLPLCAGDCNGQIQSTVSGGTMPYQYNWINLNNATNQISNLCAGAYKLQVIDSHQCVFNEEIELKSPEALQVMAQTLNPSCLGRCDGTITVSGTGGTGTYQFEWEDGVATPSLTNQCFSSRQVTMTDDNGCQIKQAFAIPDGKPVSIDLGTATTLCVGQSKILDAGSQWLNPSWTSDIGFSSTETKISIKEPGNYFFKGIDERNCIVLDTFRLETSSDLLKAEFLMPAEAIVGDTLVAIDISWPIPEKVEWNYPSSFKQIPSPANEILYAQLSEEGTFTLEMKSFLAECRDLKEKTLTVVARKEDVDSQGRLGYEELIKAFLLSPNPNDGRFSVKVELSEEIPIKLRVVQYPAGLILSESIQKSNTDHEVRFDLSTIPQGLYVVLLEVKNQQRFIRFLKQ